MSRWPAAGAESPPVLWNSTTKNRLSSSLTDFVSCCLPDTVCTTATLSMSRFGGVSVGVKVGGGVDVAVGVMVGVLVGVSVGVKVAVGTAGWKNSTRWPFAEMLTFPD